MSTPNVTRTTPIRPEPGPAAPAVEPITLADVGRRLDRLAWLLHDLAEPSERGLTEDLAISADTLMYPSETVRELAERCEAAAPEAAAGS